MYYPFLSFPLTKIQASDTDQGPPTKRQRQHDRLSSRSYNSDPPLTRTPPLRSDCKADCDLKIAVSLQLWPVIPNLSSTHSARPLSRKTHHAQGARARQGHCSNQLATSTTLSTTDTSSVIPGFNWQFFSLLSSTFFCSLCPALITNTQQINCLLVDLLVLYYLMAPLSCPSFSIGLSTARFHLVIVHPNTTHSFLIDAFHFLHISVT